MSRVLIPRGRPLEAVLSVPLWETAREALRLHADDPRPPWAAVTTQGRVFYLRDSSWVLYAVDDADEQVTVIAAGRSWRTLGLLPGFVRTVGSRPGKRERRLALPRRVHRNGSAVRAHDLAHDVEPEAESLCAVA